MTSTLIDQLASELGLNVLRLLPGGEHEAWSVRDPDHRALVLKGFALDQLPRLELAIATAHQTRKRGVPAPDPYTVGKTATAAYTLQPHCPGAVPHTLEDTHARQLLGFWPAHLDAITEGSDWPHRAMRALVVGDSELFTDHQLIRSVGGEAVGLLDEIIAVGNKADPGVLRGGDVMHGDWHHRNLLTDGDTLTAVIDWENARPGDARFDLLTLEYWSQVNAATQVSPSALRRIRAAREQKVGPDAAPILAAFLALEQLWFVCAHRSQRITETIDDIRRYLAPWWSI